MKRILAKTKYFALIVTFICLAFVSEAQTSCTTDCEAGRDENGECIGGCETTCQISGTFCPPGLGACCIDGGNQCWRSVSGGQPMELCE